ncbi:YihY/virulence factor BrkB family protein [Rhizobiaceae bacterium BDR2-2]|uniref:YihY/virulence factor BrkB family protein n=1 Tax=Ectorhizobium quercum TaxID=2965071 RepID=A0AAE3N4X4_9HYPH|nr:YihY/virulence factor BrkB family protein [Ectorhizobium quercum]MCX8999957.1 YihY/virulence factor BrkB family protein [Ectorhizobium quercum]
MPTIFRFLYKVLFDALYHFTEDDGWAMASHVALSTLLAIFPFLIFAATLAGFLGADQFADTAVHLIFDTWPEAIAEPLAAQVQQVLTVPRGGLLTISVLAAFYFASNGVEALRVSLNRAYRVSENRYWYHTRLASLGYVLVASVIFAVVSVVLVAVPVAIGIIGERLPWLTDILTTVSDWSLYFTVLILVVGLFVVHLFLPAGTRRLGDVVPGIILTLVAWLIGGIVFAFYLSKFANYTATYAGLASVMIALVFLYMVGVIFMVGAEFNAALMKYRVRYTLVRGGPFSPDRRRGLSKPDHDADV